MPEESEPHGRQGQQSDAEWKAKLSPEQYKVTRKKGTERRVQRQVLGQPRRGHVHVHLLRHAAVRVGHEVRLGHGRPSFSRAVAKDNVKEESDTHACSSRRTEVLCAACDAHLGHVFPDGPKRHGQRYCMNSAALELPSRKK
jgi:peptide-methionine (R)-S-oxide reductase